MRIVCISDTHGLLSHIPIPDGDVLIHSGDMTGIGRVEEIAGFNNVMSSLPHKHKLVIAGNHDILFQRDPNIARSLLGPRITYLEDRGITIDGVEFYGSPWTPIFGSWAFMINRISLAEMWDKIPESVNVLITHGPPHGILDKVVDYNESIDSYEERSAGCDMLRSRLAELKALKLHVFGHIHEGYGSTDLGTTKFVNASSLDESYKPVNKPIVVDL